MTDLVKKKRGPKKGTFSSVRPRHYRVNNIPTITLFDLCEFFFYEGCAVKYLLRHSQKKKNTDLLKALFYLGRIKPYDWVSQKDVSWFLRDLYPDKGYYYDAIYLIISGNYKEAIEFIKENLLDQPNANKPHQNYPE